MRIVTRPDFDGIVCAVLLQEALNIKKPVKWVEPNLMHQGTVNIQAGDIIANLAYDQRCSLWFDHHTSNRIKTDFTGLFQLAPSAARVIYGYYKNKLKKDFSELVKAADRIDSANLTEDEILFPEKYPYIMLSNTITSSKGEDHVYWNFLVSMLRIRDIKKILENHRVKSRVILVLKENQKYDKVLREHTRLIKHVSITDLRTFESTPSGNRFLVFCLYPVSNVNIKIRNHAQDKEKVIISVGRSIFNRTCHVDIGKLCARYGGGGHQGAGSCSFSRADFEKNIQEIIKVLI